jgi:hypothetical protein
MPRMSQTEVDAHQARLEAARRAKAAEGSVDPSKAQNESQRVPSHLEVGAEKELHKMIMQWLGLHGVRAVVHSRTDRPTTQSKGIADILYVTHGIPVACEVKVGRNTLTPEQVGWLEAAKLDGWLVGVVHNLQEMTDLHNEALIKAKQ